MFSRPAKWVNDETLMIKEKRYDMFKMHKFIIECLSGVEKIDKIVFKKGLRRKTGDLALYIPENDMIFIDNSLSRRKRIISLLHELFHYFFRDEDDDRERTQTSQKKDPIERRAENSAINMLQWYKKKENIRFFGIFMDLFDVIPTEKLTQHDLENLKRSF